MASARAVLGIAADRTCRPRMPSPTIRSQETGYWKQRRRSSGRQTTCADRRSDDKKEAAAFVESVRPRPQQLLQLQGTAKYLRALKASGALCSVGGGFGRGVHAVLGNFVDAAGGRLDALAVEMIELDAALADGIALFDGFRDVGLGQRGRLEQRAPSGKLRGKCGGKRTPRAVRSLFFHAVASELKDFRAVKKNVIGALHMAALDNDGASAHLDDLARGRFHVRDVFDGQPGENFGFRNVRGDDAGALQQFSGDVFDARGVEELRAAR